MTEAITIAETEGAAVKRDKVDATYVGWKQVGGYEDKDILTEEDYLLDLSSTSLLERYLPPVAYGDWYHSVGIFFVAGLLSFVVGYFRFSLAPVFFIVVLTAVFYRTSIKKFRNTIREQVAREGAVKPVEDDYESMEWLNTFLDSYWPRLEPTVSQMVASQVNDVLAAQPGIPGFIKALWIDKFTLGVKPPRVDLVKSFQNTESDVVVMDWGVSFTPADITDMTAKQMKNYVNTKVLVKAKMFGIAVPVLVEQIAFRANIRVRLHLRTAFPHVETVNIQLLDFPDVDFVARLFGESIFNWEIMAIPGLLPLVKELGTKYAGQMMMNPFSFQLNIPQLLSGSGLSMGILEISVLEAKGLKRTTSVADKSIDPYVAFDFLGKQLGKTRTVRDTLNPVWNESLFVLVDSFANPLGVTVYDKRENHSTDKVLGNFQFDLSSLVDKPVQKNVKMPFLRNHRQVGQLTFDIKFNPMLTDKKLPDGTVEEAPELNSGIVKLNIDEAKFPQKEAATYVDLYMNAKLVYTTSTVKNSQNPQFKGSYECIITDRRRCRFKLVVKDSKKKELYSTVMSLNELVDRTKIENEWLDLTATGGFAGETQLKVSANWGSVKLSTDTASPYTPPIGVLRVFLNKAEGLRNLETIGSIDPYAQVLVNDNVRGRTDTKESTLDPIWNQAVYVSLTSPMQKVSIECMDVETAGSDRTLGSFDIKMTDLFTTKDGRYEPFIEEEPRTGYLVSKKGVKGLVTYYLSFYPALPILSLDEVAEVDKIKIQKQQVADKKLETKDKAEIKKLDERMDEIKEYEDLYSNKLKLTLDELLQHPTGVLAFTFLGGEVSQPNTYIQAFFDSNGHSSYVSGKLTSRTLNQPFSGDVFIKELSWSVATFRVTKNKYNNKAESCQSEVSIPVVELVKNCYDKPSVLNLGGNASSRLLVQVQYLPILASKLPQSDLITNSGDLVVDVIGASNLLAADSNGKSDPYLKISLDDNKENLFKTKTVKKTLNPQWNESFNLEVYNRVNNYLTIEVMDWDAMDSDDKIGKAVVPLSKINPDHATPMDVPVVGPNGEDGGVIHLNFRFSPRYTMSVRKVETKVGDFATKGLSTGVNAGATVVGKITGIFGSKKKEKDEQ